METTPLMHNAFIGRPTAVGISVAFVLLLCVPPAHQLVVELRATGKSSLRSLFQGFPTRASLHQFEEDLSLDSVLAGKARRVYQTILSRAVDRGNEKIILGKDGFLFFRKEVDMVTGPGFLDRRSQARRGTGEAREERRSSDPVATIVDYQRQLWARGIQLLFVPLPVKPFIYPEKVWSGYPASAGPAGNRDREAFRSALAQAGVEVLDPTDLLWAAKGEGELFLRCDTHWTPRGMKIVAGRIADRLGPLLDAATRAHASILRTVRHDGDLLRMIEVLPGSGLFPPQTVEIQEVIGEGSSPAPILLLGDSFTNIYSRKELEWGERAGLGEQLMLCSGVPVDILAQNGGGATGVRELLSRRPDLLRNKRVVVWACSARDLFDEGVSWEPVPLPEALP
jgi:alginate O-acetyltransferase complex protein AlgJ